MNKILLPLIFLMLFAAPVKAQEKIKGSRNVIKEERDLADFNALDVRGEIEVLIKNSGTARVEIEADDNLLDIISTEVVDGTLIIKPLKEISRSKRQKVLVNLPGNLVKAVLSDKARLENQGELYMPEFELITNGDSRAELTISADTFKVVNGDKSKLELNLTAKSSYFQLNQGSSIKASVNSPELKVDIYEKAAARITGETEQFQLRADHDSKFDGEELTSTTAVVLAEGHSDNKINVAEILQLKAHGHSKTEIYNTPKIELQELTDEAVIAKKEF